MSTDQNRPKHKASPRLQKQAKKRRVIVRRPGAPQKLAFRSCMTTLAASATLLGAAGLIVGGASLSVQLIVNPDAASWVNQFLPEWTRIPVGVREPIQTLAQIQAGLSKKGLIAGEALFLSSDKTTSELILPVQARRSNCQINCQQIVELRVYQLTDPKDKDKYYQLVTQVAIAGPEESAVIAPQNQARAENHQKARLLPLTQLSRFQGQVPPAGVWLNLSGKVQGKTMVNYGQVLHYNPTSSHLSVMMSWSSLAGQAPYWQEVTGGDAPELVVNQTVGKEPMFRVYQLKPRIFMLEPIQLEEISLAQPALDSQAYRNALILAKSGLWSPALEWLESLRGKEWSSFAEAQMDLIRLHAQATQAQLKKPWASPAEQVLVHLIDGRWQEALQVFQILENQRFEIVTMLKTDSSHLWKRVEAAIKVNPAQSDVQIWGAMIVAAKEGRPKAIAWVKQQPQNTLLNIARINQLLDQMEASSAAATLLSNHFSQVIGLAKLVNQVNPADWLQPAVSPGTSTPPLQHSEQQVWYQVQVTMFNDGQHWRHQPFADLTMLTSAQASELWKLLGLGTTPQIQIALWKPDGSKKTTMTTVKAAQLKNGILQLLAVGEVFPGFSLTSFKSPESGVQNSQFKTLPLRGAKGQNSNLSEAHFFATSEKAISWLDPQSITLADLSQMQPQWATLILPTLWSELQAAHIQPPGPIPSLSAMLQLIGKWPVQTIDLTANNQPEAVVIIDPAMVLSLKKSSGKFSLKNSQLLRRRTMIFADTGALIYSEFTNNTAESLVAIADLGDGGSPVLVLQGASNYTLKRWSIERQHFD